MDLKLPRTAMYGNSQTIPIEKVAILIGENGSGKSCILQSIFEESLKGNEDYANFRIVCSSSGQNENYSQILKQHLNGIDEKHRTFMQNCFYCDKSWTKFLIFLAIAIRPNGKVSSLLKAQENFGGKVKDPLKTKLSFTLKIDQEYMDSVDSDFGGETGTQSANLSPLAFHAALRNFVDALPNVNHDFSESFTQEEIQVNAKQWRDFVIEPSDAQDIDVKKTKDGAPKLDFDIAFYTQAAFDDRFIDKSSIQLHFEAEFQEMDTEHKRKFQLEMDFLSDGECQLFQTFALADLFDSEYTLFLLDDVDSHLHFDLNAKIWPELHKIKGKVLATTHQIDTIFAKDIRIDHTHLVEGGKIVAELYKARKIHERLKILSHEEYYEFELCGKFPKAVVIDGYRDWMIFKSLARRKGLDVKELSDILVIEKGSGFSDSTESFGQAKFEWVANFKKFVPHALTKKIFLICDRDDAELQRKNGGLEIIGTKFNKILGRLNKGRKWKVETRLFALKRREIENYLLSFTAMNELKILKDFNNNSIPLDDHLKKRSPCDNESVENADVKELFSEVIDVKGMGLDEGKLDEYVNLIHQDEISDDIEEMFDILIGG